MLRIIASSGFAPDTARAQAGISRLQAAGFAVTNEQAVFRRYQRFAGSDAERIADVQDVASGRVPTPKVLMGMRGGYGAHRLLQHIDFASLGAQAKVRGNGNGGYSVTFSGYPTLDKSGLYLDSLLPQQDFIEGIVTATPEDKTDLE